MDKLNLLTSTYQKYGWRGARTLTLYYLEKQRATFVGPGRRCPVCGWHGPNFYPQVHPAIGVYRPRAVCPSCGAAERHRALSFFYDEFFKQHPHHRRILHFAPERCFRPLFTAHSDTYTTSNFDHENSDMRADLHALGICSNSIDLVVANGVLTSVLDRQAAIRELYRVLVPNGFALICDLVEPFGVTRDLPDKPLNLSFVFGGASLSRDFWPFAVECFNIESQLSDTLRLECGLRIDHFHTIKLQKRLE